MARKITLIVIDPQNSFCKVVDAAEQQVVHNGELCISGAWDDMERVAGLVDRLGRKIDEIKVTLDSHQQFHISHPIWYRNLATGAPPDPFTFLKVEGGRIYGYKDPFYKDQVGEFDTFIQGVQSRTVKYLESLVPGQRYPHCIWPVHCLISWPGHNVVEPLGLALLKWELTQRATVDYLTKGSNPFCEHFSAVQAEVPDPDDPSTQINTEFINIVMEADDILLTGEAGSHCLANTVRDMANTFPDDSFIKKCILLTDCTSPVPTLEFMQEEFVKEMVSRGMKTSTSIDYLS